MAPRSGFGAAISDAVARSSIVFCNSLSADRIVTAASRLLGAAAACIILAFAAGHRKSYWNGCIKAAIMICQQIFLILELVICLLKFLLKVLQDRVVFALAPRSGFGATISVAIMYRKASLCNNFFL